MAVTPFVLKGGQSFDTGESQSELLYVAYFGRAAEPGPGGLNFWTEALENGLPILNAAGAFAAQPEAQALYPFLANPAVASQAVRESFINDIFNNLYNRSADPVGLAFYENALETIQNQFIQGQITAEQLSVAVGEFVLAVAQGAQGSDAQTLANKVDVALYFTEQLIINNVPYDADADLVSHQVVDDTTSSPSSVAQQEQVVDNFVQFGLGQTIDLTPEQDIVNTSGADDIINGQAEQTNFLPLQTLNSFDKINTDGGRDVMNVSLVNAFTVPALLAGLEQINFTEAPGFISPNWTLDVINADALDTFTFSQLNNDSTIDNVKTLISNIEINNYSGGNDIFINLIGAASDGAADALSLLVNNVGQGKGSIDLDIDTDSAAADAGYETLNIDSVGGVTNDIDVVGSAIHGPVSEIFVTGDTDLELNNNFGDAWDAADVDLIDASALGAGLTTWVLGTGDVEFRGGSGDDHPSFGGNVNATAFGNDGDDLFTFFDQGGKAGKSSFTTADFVDGGDGFDAIEIEAHSGALLAAGVGAGIVNVERIIHETFGPGPITGDISVNMAESGSATELELAGNYAGAGGANDVTVTNLLNDDIVFYTGDFIDDLELAHASPGFLSQVNLDMGDQADIEGALIVNGLVSATYINISGEPGGEDTNRIDEADQIDTDVLITGGINNLDIGLDGAFDFNGQIIDASAFTGELGIALGDNHQRVITGLGDDYVDVRETAAGDQDLIDLSPGGDDVVEFDDDQNGDIPLDFFQPVIGVILPYHQIEGFEVGTGGAADPHDEVHLDVGNDIDIFFTNANNDVDPGNTVSILNAAAGGTFNGTLQSYNFIKFTTEVESDTIMPAVADTAQQLFNEAISGGEILVSNALNQEEILGAMYDGSYGNMILFTVNTSNGGPTGEHIVLGNDVDVITQIHMTYEEFLAFDGTNLVYV